ncbi:MAG: EI24 domain-containing protein [Nitrospinae bacterium]|nr:EI24 domain-containing protein [Nitrospinota bacterium]
MKNFLIAITYPIKGIQFTFSHKPLRQLAIIPIGLSFIFFLAALYCVYVAMQAYIFPGIEYGDAWYFSVLESIVFFFAYCLLFIVSAVISFLFTDLSSSLIFDRLSLRTQQILQGDDVRDDSSLNFVEPVISEIRKFSIYIIALIVIFPLNIIPVIGHPLFIGLSALISTFFFSYDFFDHSLSRQGMNFNEKKKFIVTNKSSSLGFGLGVFLLFLIPFSAVILVPCSVVAGTMLVHKLSEK